MYSSSEDFNTCPCVHRLARSYSSSFRVFAHDPRLIFPRILGTKVLSPQARLPPYLRSVRHLISHLCHNAHRSQCPTGPTRSHVCPAAPPPTSIESPWHPPLLATPTPHFPFQERSNYTEISTEKDRLLLWHQHQGSCKSGAAAIAASGHCAVCRGALTSTPHFVPPLSSCLGLCPCPGSQSPIWFLPQWSRGRYGQ